MFKILIIEDDPDVRDNLQMILDFENFQVYTAENGQQGVQIAQAEHPDLIICDIMMPIMDGYSVRNTLCNDPTTALIPFIFLTAKTDHHDFRLGMALGADDYIPKPFTRDELMEAIYARLDKQAAVQGQIQQRCDALCEPFYKSLPTQLLSPLTQIQDVLQSFIKEYDSLDPLEILNMSRGAYTSSILLQRHLHNFLQYSILEVALQDPEKVASLRHHCVSQTKPLIRDAATSMAQLRGRKADLKLELEAITVQILEANLIKIAEELIDIAFKFSLPGSQVIVSSYVADKQFVLNITNESSNLLSDKFERILANTTLEPELSRLATNDLGINIVKLLTSIHEGQLNCASTPEGKTQISTSLPLVVQ